MSGDILPSVMEYSSRRVSTYSTRRYLPTEEEDEEDGKKDEKKDPNEEISLRIDAKFYDEISQIQQQYNIYEYEYKKNYKSWGSSDKGEMMTSKEYNIMWEWFKEVLKEVEVEVHVHVHVDREDGIVQKTLVYYTLVNDVFGAHREAVRYFERMKLSHDDLVLSFTHFISVLSDSSIEQSVKLRQHIKDKRKNKSKRKKKKSEGEEDQDKEETTSSHSNKSLPFLNASPHPSTRTSKSHSTRTPSDDDNSSYFPTISSSGSTRVHQHDPEKSRSRRVSTDGNSERIRSRRVSTDAVSTNKATSSKTSSVQRNKSVSSARPGGRLSSIGRAFRRQLSRLTGDTMFDDRDRDRDRVDDDGEGVPHDDKKGKKKEKKKGKKEKDKEKKRKESVANSKGADSHSHSHSDVTPPHTCTDSFDEKEKEKPAKPAKLEKSNSVLTNIGRNVRRQLNRLSSGSEK
jgi:hypothetical protein